MTNSTQSWLDTVKDHLRPRTQLMLVFGFSSGLPFYLIYQTLTYWMREEGVSRGEIGMFAWVGFAFTIKVLWAPFLDRVPVPFLEKKIGRRRSWMAIAQCGVVGTLLAMSFADPANNLQYVAIVAILIAFCAATQDIAVDAWRIEAGPDKEQGALAAMYQLGYRFGIIVSSAGALLIADSMSWPIAYQAMAAIMLIIVCFVLFTPRVELPPPPPPARKPVKIAAKEAVIDPFMDFIKRYGFSALIILLLVGSYRIPDFVMGVMTGPLYVDIGYTKTEVAFIVKTFGIWVMILGAFLGGISVNKFGFKTSLVVGVLGQSLSNLVYSWLAMVEPLQSNLFIAIISDNIAYGFAGTVLIAYMSSLTNRAFTATQYALFSSAYAIPGKFFAGFSGFVVDAVDYPLFFVITALVGIPSLLLIFLLGKFEKKSDKTSSQHTEAIPPGF